MFTYFTNRFYRLQENNIKLYIILQYVRCLIIKYQVYYYIMFKSPLLIILLVVNNEFI